MPRGVPPTDRGGGRDQDRSRTRPQPTGPGAPGVVQRPVRLRMRTRFTTAQGNRHPASTWASPGHQNGPPSWTVFRYPMTGSTPHRLRGSRRHPAWVRKYRRRPSCHASIFETRPCGAVTARPDRASGFPAIRRRRRGAPYTRGDSAPLPDPASASTPGGVRPASSQTWLAAGATLQPVHCLVHHGWRSHAWDSRSQRALGFVAWEQRR